MGHYDALRQAMADKQRQEEIEREKVCPGTKTVDIPVLICEIVNEMNALKQEVTKLKLIVALSGLKEKVLNEDK